jgi:hypothetical protein
MYAAQIGVAPPSFVFFTNVATTFHFSYERFLVNKLREEFGFVGSPIRIQVRRRHKNTNVGGTRRPRPARHDAVARSSQRERRDRRAAKNRPDKKED